MRLMPKPILLLLFALATPFSHAEDDFLSTGRYEDVNPQTKEKKAVQIFNRVQVAKEYNVIRYFFTYTCEYGEKYDRDMQVWASSLPAGFQYVRVPVITQEPNTVTGAFAYYAAYLANRIRIGDFQREAYDLIKRKGKDPSDIKTYIQAAKQAKYDINAYQKALLGNQVNLLVKNAIILGAKYNVNYTPTLTIGGLYSINPEPIAGDKISFIEFANAIASKYIMENKSAITQGINVNGENNAR